MGQFKKALLAAYEDGRVYRQFDYPEIRAIEREVIEQDVPQTLDFQIKYVNAYGGPGVYGVSLPPQDNIFEQLVRLARHWENPTFYWLMKSDMGYREIEIYGDLQWTEMEL